MRETLSNLTSLRGVRLRLSIRWGGTALHYASLKGHTQIVKMLLQDEAIDVNARDENGAVAPSCRRVHKMNWNRHRPDISLSRWPSLEEMNWDGDPLGLISIQDRPVALHYASIGGHAEIVKMLLRDEAIDVNARDDFDATPLHYASHLGRTEIVDILLQDEAIHVNVRDGDRKTPLCSAALSGMAKTVERILEEVEATDVNDIKYCNPLLIASSRGHTEGCQDAS